MAPAWPPAGSRLVTAAVVATCADAFGPQLRAMILAGSLARDEGSFQPTETGTILLGDAEFVLLFHDRIPLPAPARVTEVESAVEARLLKEGLLAEIQLSPCHSQYLRSLEPHVLAYELRVTGRVVWGEADVLSLVPPFSSEQIPLEDAWRLLNNRLVEQLEPLSTMEWPCAVPPPAVRYRTVKLYLDMGTSFLLFAGAYAPTYRDRARGLRRLAERGDPAVECPLLLAAFASRVEACTRYKLEGAGGDDLGTWTSWAGAIDAAHVLWKWQLARLTAAPEGMGDHGLRERWRRGQPAWARLRGWLHVLRNRGWHRSWREWPRWARLGFRATPRLCVYDAGTELLFALAARLGTGREPDIDCAALTRSLPVRFRDQEGAGTPWQEIAREVSCNYRDFLVGTRA